MRSTATSGAPGQYRIRGGDTLGGIAERFGANSAHRVDFDIPAIPPTPVQFVRLEALKAAPDARLVEIEVEALGDNLVSDLRERGGAVEIIIGTGGTDFVEATLTNALPNLSPALPDGLQSLSGDGWDVGWSAGAQADAGPVTVGLSYKSKIEHDLKGELNVSGLLGPLAAQNRSLSDVHATYSTPWQAIGSVRYAATNNLTLNAQVIRYGWSEFDAIRLGDPVNTAIPEDYKNSWSYAGGFDLKVDPKLTLRAGVQYAETPIRNDYRDARVPDSDRWNFATGASVQVSKAFAVDVAANYIRFKDAPITKPAGAYVGTPAQTLVGMNGELNDASAVVLSLGGRLSF